MIPKIIFQTAPTDINRWKNSWNDCRNSWKKIFPEDQWNHILWNDEECENFMKNEFPRFYQMYMSFDLNIKRADMIRYFFLYKYGGIYADMDYEVIKDFYDILPQNKISIVESPYQELEKVQNSLMVSDPGNSFWMKVIEKSKSRIFSDNILFSTGPVLLGDTIDENIDLINILPSSKFNPRPGNESFFDSSIYSRHHFTGFWYQPDRIEIIEGKRYEDIRNTYLELLDREPDGEGLNFYYYSGKTIESIRKDIINSDERKMKK